MSYEGKVALLDSHGGRIQSSLTCFSSGNDTLRALITQMAFAARCRGFASQRGVYFPLGLDLSRDYRVRCD